jgi:hypothetical protein
MASEQPKNPYRSNRDKLFRRAMRLMRDEGLNESDAMTRAMKELGLPDYSKEPTPESPEFEGIKPMSLEELMAHRDKSRPQV